MPLGGLSIGVELHRTVVLVGYETGSPRTVLDLGEHLAHAGLDASVDDPWTRGVVAVLRRVGHRPTLFGNAALVHQVDDQFELMQTLEVRHLRLVARFHQRLVPRLDQ
jgi:hypothetical protein